MEIVVLDTNVFVAASFNRGSRAAQIVAAVRAGELLMVWSAQTRDEIATILRRIPHCSWDEVAALFRPEGEAIAPLDVERFAAVPDPADRPFAALAAATGATLISNDEHLLSYARPLGVDVQTPSTFWMRRQPRGA